MSDQVLDPRVHNNYNVVVPEGPAPVSFRDQVEKRLDALEGGDQSSIRGLLRTYEDRIATLETELATSVSNYLKLGDRVVALEKKLP